MSGLEVKRKRVSFGISAVVLSKRAGVCRSQLSLIENGHVSPSQLQLAKITGALDELVVAKRVVSETARRCGWPISEL